MKHQNKYAQLVEAQSPEPPQTTVVDNDEEDEHLVSVVVDATGNSDHQTSADAVDLRISTSYQTCTENDHSCSSLSLADEPSAGSSGSSSSQVANGKPATKNNKHGGKLEVSQLSLGDSKQQQQQTNNNMSVANRRASQVSATSSSSQMSTCFVSTTDSGGRRSQTSAEALATAATTTTATNTNIKKNSNKKQQLQQAAAATMTTNLKRTISQSMLELDQSHRLDNFEVSWRNLSFSYGAKWTSAISARFRNNNNRGNANQQPLVLNNISGKFRSNQLIAIIGPSGCGKTTLLQFLAGNNPHHKNRLRIVGLDEPKVAFIGQDDCLLPGLTARETLIYASKLQNSKPNFDHEHHILPILDGLGLSECADRSVTKLSGGQAKRVTIAQEMLYPTNLLILDEVTSGLDASTSYSIIKLLKRLVSDQRYPMSIVMSIHQPSARLFAIFDKVYVMSEGCCIYEGSCNINEVNTYLGQFGLECPKFHNIADYLIEVASEADLIATDGNDHQAHEQQQQHQFVKEQMINYQRKQVRQEFESSDTIQYKRSAGNNNNEHQMVLMATANGDDDAAIKIPEEQVRLNGNHNSAINDEELKSMPTTMMNSSLYEAVEVARYNRKRPIYNQFLIHFSRSLLRIRRSYILTYLQLITYILLGLQLSTFYGSNIGTLSGCPQLPMSFIAFVFSNETNDNDALEMRRIQENMNFLLVAIMTATFAALEITVITFPMEAKTVKREWRNGWYRVSSYFMGRTLADLPFQLVFVIVFCVVIYTLTGQIGLLTWRFGSFVTIIVMTALIAQTVGFIFGAIFMDNLPAAVFTAPLCIFPALLFSGFFSRASQVPSFYKPLTFLSHFRYAFDALLVTLYGYDRCKCDQIVLTSYHESLKNQTITIKEMFKSLFGSVDCASGGNSGGGGGGSDTEENSIEDTTGIGDLLKDHLLSDNPLNMILNQTTRSLININTTSTTNMPPNTVMMQTIKPIEDALVDRVFEHMSNSSEPAEFKGDAMDRLTQKFSTRITTMLNSQANFGHEVPVHCQDFNSYLMTEFDLHNDDLMIGLLMLFVFVILTRFMCNFILSFTIARRSR